MRTVLLLLAALPLAACAHSEADLRPDDAPPAQAEGAPTVSMSYQPELGDLVIEADRPVQVAVFIVYEKSTPRMLYPVRSHRVARVEPGRPLRVSSRYHGLPTERIGAGNRDLSSQSALIEEPDPRGDADPVPPARGHDPVYLYALASTEPLRTEAIVERNGTVEYDRAFSHNVLAPKLQVLATRLLTTRADSTWTGVLEVLWR